MPFMVIYRTSDGTSRYEQADAIDEAALFVERLRNSERIDQIRIYRMEEISFAFRPYYKVELGLPERQMPTGPRDVPTPAVVAVDAAELRADPASAPETDPPAEAHLEDTPAAAQPSGGDVQPTGANGRSGLFGR